MTPFIQMTRYPYEEPDIVNLIVAASNGRVRGQLEIFTNANDLATLARALLASPNPTNDDVTWELGSEDPQVRFAFYFRLRVKQVASNGLCAVELRLNNNQMPPDREVTEFSILALPADLDRLARLLEEFGKFQHRVLVWNVTDGELLLDVKPAC